MIVEAPDGKAIDFGSMPDADVSAAMAKMYPPKLQRQPIGARDAALSSAIEAVPFGADLAAAFDALQNPRPGKSFGENQAASKAMMMDAVRQGRQEEPYASVGGSVVGALSTVPLIPAKALQGASVLSRALKAGAVGAGLGALHGAGTGNTMQERANNATAEGVTGAAFGAAASPVSDLIGVAVKPAIVATRNLASRVANLIKTKPSTAVSGVPAAGLPGVASGTAQQIPTAAARPAETIDFPLTQGQATQDPRLQALESGAVAGNYGDEAQIIANESRVLQSDKAKQIAQGVAGKELTPNVASDSVAAISDNLRSAYSAARDKTASAYNKLGAMTEKDGLNIAADYVRNGIAPSFKQWADKGSNGLAWNLDVRGMENAKKLYQDFEKIVPENIDATDFWKMENWRSGVTQAIGSSQDKAEKAFLGGLLQRYDVAMKQLPREAIKSGDEGILKALEYARSSRREQGALFERSKLVRDIVQNEDLTNEQFANSILSLGAKSGSYVRDIFRAAGKDPALRDKLETQTKQALLGSIVNKSLSAEAKAGGTIESGIERMISFDKLATNLDRLISNKTLFNAAFQNEGDRKALQQLYNAASLVKSAKPGTKNYSNTAYTLLNAIQRFSPALASSNIAGVGVGSAFKAMGKAGASNELEQSLAPVLKGITDSANNITNFGKTYGRAVMAAESSSAGIRQLGEPDAKDNIPTITVRPKREQQ